MGRDVFLLLYIFLHSFSFYFYAISFITTFRLIYTDLLLCLTVRHDIFLRLNNEIFRFALLHFIDKEGIMYVSFFCWYCIEAGNSSSRQHHRSKWWPLHRNHIALGNTYRSFCCFVKDVYHWSVSRSRLFGIRPLRPNQINFDLFDSFKSDITDNKS